MNLINKRTQELVEFHETMDEQASTLAPVLPVREGAKFPPLLPDSKDYCSKNVPEELKNSPQWVCWRLENRDGKTSKVPVNVHTGRKAYTNKSETWATFREVLEYFQAKRPEVGGIGFVFTGNDPFAGVDLDACVDPETGKIEDWAMEIIQGLNSYTEISPRGHGVHVLVKGKLPPGGNRKGKIEMYDSGRFFTMTGKHLEGTPLVIEERNDALTGLHKKVFPKLSVVKPEEQTQESKATSELSDDEIIAKAFSAKDGGEFSRLWNGDISQHGDDDSRADITLCRKLAFWCGNDPKRIDRIFRQSKLMRPKWDSVRGDSTYGAITIEKAMQSVYEHYSGLNFSKPDSPKEPSTPKAVGLGINMTDLGNAKRLVAKFGHKIRYCSRLKCWFVWEGKRWVKDDTHEIERLAKETILSIYEEASKEENEQRRRELASFGLKCESSAKLTSMVALAKSEQGMAIRPEDLDQNHWLFNCQNGTIDLRTGRLSPHRKQDLITKLAPVSFDPKAECKEWLRFLEKIMGGKASLVRFLKRAVGYSLTGDTSEQCLFFLYGLGANGKSTFLAILREMLGDYAKQTGSETFLIKRSGGIPNDLAALRGSRLVNAIEIENGRLLAESIIKQATGGDRISARFLHCEFFEFDPTFKIFLAANHKPVIKGTDWAIWRRIRLIPFEVKIPETDQIRNYADKLKNELPGILAWAVEGCLEWQKEGLGNPDEVKRATQDYKEEMDTLGDFFTECCVANPQAQAQAKDLYQAYVKWAEENGEKQPLGQTKFGMALSERGYTRAKGPRGKRIRLGIGLREHRG